MKIVMVVHGFPPRETAGTEWHSYLLAKELSKRHEVYVFSRGSGESYLEYEDDFDGIPVRRINSPISFTGWNTHIDDRVALSFSDFLNSLKPDLIHVQHCIGLGMSTIEVAIERCIPTLLFLHDFYFLCHRTHLIKTNGQLCLGPSNQQYCMDCILASEPSLGKDDAREHGLRRYNYVREILSKADHIVVPTEFVKEILLADLPYLRKITVSTLGLDLSVFENCEKKYSNRLRFGYIGGIYPHKGVHLLVEAFNGLVETDSELRVHGGGDPAYLDTLRQTASNKNIFFLGPYEHHELAKILSEIDVFVMPSMCHESFSMTIGEALAAGIPVLVSDARAQADAIVEGVNGLHFKCADLNDLKEKLEQIVTDRNLVKQLTKHAGKSPVRSIDVQAAQLEILYRKLVQRRRRGVHADVGKTFPLGRPLANLLSYIRSLEETRRNLEETRRNLEMSRISLTEELNKSRTSLAQCETEIKGLEAELRVIKHSFGYLSMRFYATRIDRLFPEGTRRGELRKIVATSIATLAQKTFGETEHYVRPKQTSRQ